MLSFLAEIVRVTYLPGFLTKRNVNILLFEKSSDKINS